MLITRAEIDGAAPIDLRIAGGRIAEIGRALPRRCRRASARRRRRRTAPRPARPPHPPDGPGRRRGIGALRPSTGSKHRVAGECPREAARNRAGGFAEWATTSPSPVTSTGHLLDDLAPDRPVRIQHRSGAMWVVNSPAVDHLGLDRGVDQPGVERDATGRATGRLFRLDAWLRERLEDGAPPSLADVSLRLASFGVTGLTDATADNSSSELRAFVAAAERGELLQRLLVMGGRDLPSPTHGMVERGALKVLLDESDLPSFEQLQGIIETAHGESRSVAVHCVTRSELVLAAAAFAAARRSTWRPDRARLGGATRRGPAARRSPSHRRHPAGLHPRARRRLPRRRRAPGSALALPLRGIPTRLGATRRKHRRPLRRSGSLDGDARGGRSPHRSRGHHRLRRGAHTRASPCPVHLAPRATGRGAAPDRRQEHRRTSACSTVPGRRRARSSPAKWWSPPSAVAASSGRCRRSICSALAERNQVTHGELARRNFHSPSIRTYSSW